jgi:hypothetical protein
MSYHRFSNLRELFQGHLSKVLLNVDSEHLRDRPCNCPGRGSCRYNNICRKALLVYKVTIPQTGKYYIGASSQPLKKRMAGHLQDTRKLLKDGVRSSTLASHLAQMRQQNNNSVPSAGMLRDELTYSILGKVILSAVQKRLVNLHVNCVRRSGLRCSGTLGRMG